ncbi:MAG: hypothetical protein HY722_06210 [Planctomycetes bacterium]|nr:hypothetical protein [Planctomycetota bacterium]
MGEAIEWAPERSAGANSNGVGAGGPAARPPDPEVPEKAQRRQFTAGYKLKVLCQAEACTRPGEVGVDPFAVRNHRSGRPQLRAEAPPP